MNVLDRAGPRRLLREPAVARVLTALAAEREETRLVGGCVRDALLGRIASDVDLATTLLPEAILARARSAGLRSIPTGIEHGTITLLSAGSAIEVTTLREDVETDGRHAVVRFGRDFARDAERRDFTINALSVGFDGTLHDPTGGIADLEDGRVRFIGDARTRIHEDALRILRFFRFHARYGRGAPDGPALDACIRARDALDGLSRERIRAEFLKLLVAPGVLPAVEILSASGLLMRLTGGPGDLGRLGRAIRAPDRQDGLSPDPIPRLAALAVFSGNDAERLRRRLRLSRSEFVALDAYARALTILHDQVRVDGGGMRRLAATLGIQGLAAALAATRGEPRPMIDAAALDLLDAMVRGDRAVPVLPVTGADLVVRGVAPGPDVGRRLAIARALWMELGCPDDEVSRADLIRRALA